MVGFSGITSALALQPDRYSATASVRTLLGQGDKHSADIFSAILGAEAKLPLGNGVESSGLEAFIKDNVPNNEKLLADLAAVTALSSVFSDELSPSAQYVSPIQAFLAGQTGDNKAVGSLVSLLA